MRILLWTVIVAATASAVSAAPIARVAELRRGHRLLIVSAAPGDDRLVTQRSALAAWRRQGEERDVVAVFLEGSKVMGASDAASAIRGRYAVPATRFALTLVGKDGHVAYRSSEPVSGAQLEQTIDAMPMRRAGQR